MKREKASQCQAKIPNKSWSWGPKSPGLPMWLITQKVNEFISTGEVMNAGMG
jgi:hypothetical protein